VSDNGGGSGCASGDRGGMVRAQCDMPQTVQIKPTRAVTAKGDTPS